MTNCCRFGMKKDALQVRQDKTEVNASLFATQASVLLGSDANNNGVEPVSCFDIPTRQTLSSWYH